MVNAGILSLTQGREYMVSNKLFTAICDCKMDGAIFVAGEAARVASGTTRPIPTTPAVVYGHIRSTGGV